MRTSHSAAARTLELGGVAININDEIEFNRNYGRYQCALDMESWRKLCQERVRT